MLDRLDDTLPSSPEPPSRPPAHQAAVAAVLYGQRRLQLLFIVRATVAGDPWSGHVAFPGGRREAADATLFDTAVRETREELDLDLTNGRYLGALGDVGPVSRSSPLIVRPFVFHLPTLPELRPNREVAGVVQAPLTGLLDGAGRGTMPFEWKGQELTLPRVDLSGHRLWGLTLRMVDDMLHRLDGEGVGLARPARLGDNLDDSSASRG